MKHWNGFMDWELEKTWNCEICGKNYGLEWGIVHASCRCKYCHAEYRMRNDKDEVVKTPVLNIKEEYIGLVKAGYNIYKKPIDEFNSNEWKELENMFQISIELE